MQSNYKWSKRISSTFSSFHFSWRSATWCTHNWSPATYSPFSCLLFNHIPRVVYLIISICWQWSIFFLRNENTWSVVLWFSVSQSVQPRHGNEAFVIGYITASFTCIIFFLFCFFLDLLVFLFSAVWSIHSNERAHTHARAHKHKRHKHAINYLSLCCLELQIYRAFYHFIFLHY